jgi:HEAT repeat protein
MNKKIISLLIAALISTTLWAQQPRADLRTTNTKIADLLMQLPSTNSAELDRIMLELTKLGAPVVETITASLVAPGKGNDSQLRYALSGLVKYASDGNDLKIMQLWSESIIKALAAATDAEVKDFLLQELQFVAGNEAVGAVAPYLVNPRLSDPAARVMVRINTTASNQALADAIGKAETAQKTVLVKALGETRSPAALPSIRNLTGTNDPMLKKAVLRTLAETGDQKSAKLLASAAKKTGYLYDFTEATEAYFVFLRRSAESGNSAVTIREATKLANNKNIPTQAKSSALRLLYVVSGENATPVVMQALNSPDMEYRLSAHTILADMFSPKIAESLLAKVSTEKDNQLKSELISLLGDQKYKNAYPVVKGLLNDNDKQVQLAAIEAAAKTGRTEAIDPLVALFRNNDPDIITAAQKALLTIEGEKVANAAAAMIPGITGNSRAALIDLIASRQADRHAGLIFAEAANSDATIRETAASALRSLVKPGDEAKIANLLNKAKSDSETASLQQALIAAISQTGDKGKQVSTVTGLMKNSSGQSDRYYSVLASIGGIEALQVVEEDMKKGSAAQKVAAVKALTSWSDNSAMPLLFSISEESAQGNLRDIALSGYINGINRSGHPTDQRVLMLRKAMELASGKEQKTLILSQLARNPTLPALAFAAKYLDNNELQQAAVQTVRNIVLANNSLFGPAVKDIVSKAISVNKDPEADYQKQALLKHLSELPQTGGFVSMFNEKDLTGWKGLVGNPISRSKMTPQKLAEEQKKADERMRRDWRVENGILIFEGEGYDNLCSEKMYADFEFFVDWRMEAKGDGGIYLRGTPQVQTWDTSRVEAGAQVGSGGLYNNQKYRSTPLLVADNPINEWNTFHIRMIGDKVTVYLNGQLVTDNVVLENYWDRKIPIFDKEAIELQAHGTRLDFRDIYVREIPRPEPYVLSREEQEEGFLPMFNGIDMSGWIGNTIDYFPQEGMIVCQPSGQGHGNLFTDREYSDFIMRFEFQLTPGANNGLGIRTPTTGDAAYAGMELQILDNEAEIYRNLQPYQYHGSVYGVIPAKRGYLKPVGEWNYQEVQAIGNRIKITLNGEVILDGDIAEASKNGTETIDKLKHPGLLNKSGHIGFLGHGSPLKFRNLRIKDLGNP